MSLLGIGYRYMEQVGDNPKSSAQDQSHEIKVYIPSIIYTSGDMPNRHPTLTHRYRAFPEVYVGVYPEDIPGRTA